MAQTYDFVNASVLLRDGIYEVPDYQRNYAWVSQQVRDLWEDVSAIARNADHYTGTVIVKKLENLTKLGKAFTRFELIDGQQRLATTVILLASICYELKKLASSEARKTAKNVLTDCVRDAGTDTYKLKLNHGDDSYLKDVILRPDAQQMVAKEPAAPSETKLREARSYFAAQLANKTEEELQDLVNKVLNGLKFTRFQVDTDAEAGLIFEGTNNRGRPLNDLDKIKNYLMYISYKANDDPLATEINEAWAEVLRNIFNSPGLSEQVILRYHWVMRTGVAKEYDVHSRLKETLRPPFTSQHLAEIRDYVETLKEASYVIRELSDPEVGFKGWSRTQVDGIAEHVNGLHRLRVFATFYPLVVASRITLRSDPEMFRKIVAACEAFALRVYKIANRRADTGLTMFATQARAMFSSRGKSAGEIQSACRGILEAIGGYVDTYGNDDDVARELKYHDITTKLEGYEIRHLLGELERWKCRSAKEKPLGWAELEKATMEHIWAQHPEGMGTWSDGHWSRHRRLVNSLGNLTLTFWNSQLSNKRFGRKRLRYAESNLRIQRELAESRRWQESQITGRRDQLIDFVLERWQVPTL